MTCDINKNTEGILKENYIISIRLILPKLVLVG